MSTLEKPPIDEPPTESAPSASDQPWIRFEALLEKASERLNPIVVKEARQALKSRQFIATFLLVLTAAWLWSMFGTALIGPAIYYSSNGPDLFYGYYIILAFPLLVVVPFGAFRSMTAELEDRTYELLAITALSPRQIVTGKMAAAVLQMLIYLSAVLPCLAFTYLLRGIDILMIVTVVAYTVMGSLAFSLVALLFSTASVERYQQVLISVLLICSLVAGFWCAVVVAQEFLNGAQGLITEPDYWIFNAVLLTFCVSASVIVLLATAAQLTEPSRNRATPLRLAMLMQHALLTGWMTFVFMMAGRSGSVLSAYIVMVCVHWYIFGALMTGESPLVSPRAKRSLPQTFAGRVFLTWLNPGPGTGYMFAVCTTASAVVLVWLALATQFAGGLGTAAAGMYERNAFYVSVLSLCYLTIYLGLGKLILDALRQAMPVGMLTRLLVHILLLALGSLVPVSIQLSSPTMRSSGYSLLQVSNPFWTLVQFAGNSEPFDKDVLLLLLVPAAGLVMLANMPGILRELSQVRLAPPPRVAKDDAEIEAVRHPVVVEPTSPWG